MGNRWATPPELSTGCPHVPQGSARPKGACPHVHRDPFTTAHHDAICTIKTSWHECLIDPLQGVSFTLKSWRTHSSKKGTLGFALTGLYHVTRYSTIGMLLGHAKLVTTWCEAPSRMEPFSRKG